METIDCLPVETVDLAMPADRSCHSFQVVVDAVTESEWSAPEIGNAETEVGGADDPQLRHRYHISPASENQMTKILLAPPH